MKKAETLLDMVKEIAKIDEGPVKRGRTFETIVSSKDEKEKK